MPKTEKITTTIRIPVDLWSDLKHAQADGRLKSVNHLAIRLLKIWVSKPRPGASPDKP